MKFDFIKNHEKIFPIEKMCKVLKVSQSGYYRWKNNVITNIPNSFLSQFKGL